MSIRSRGPLVCGMTDKTEAKGAAFRVLLALSLSHGLNDIIQAMLPSIYPLLKASYDLTFTQIGLITFVFLVVASLLQPLVGHFTDRRPQPYSLTLGMSLTLLGLVLLAEAASYPVILLAAALIGMGSSIFHPEASRLARLASGGRHGFAQSLFQVGGNFGSALGPLLAALIVVPRGQPHVMWFSLLALVGIFVLARVGGWYRRHLNEMRRNNAHQNVGRAPFSTAKTVFILAVLGMLLFSKFVYLTSMTSYYTFYMIGRFQVTLQHAQVFLFIFLFATAVGTILGGPLGDRFGRKIVIWISILGAAPFSLLLPHAGLIGCAVLSVFVGVILASAFSVILVYAQELVPGKVGLIAGLFFGVAFGIGGFGSVLLGKLADETSIFFVFDLCAYLPLLGLLTVFLPNLERVEQRG